MRTVAALLAALVLLSGCGADSPKADAPARLPDIALTPLDGGDPVELSTLRGPMVINLWASWCTPCRKELPFYQALAEKYAGRLDVLGVDFQETRPDAARALARETGLTYPLLTDPDGRLRAIGLPKLVLLDREGTVAHEEYLEVTSLAQLEAIVAKHLEVAS